MLDDEVDKALVIDNGTWMCRAGWAGDDTARAYVRTVVGEKDGSKCFDDYTINQTSANRCPMERGIVTDWDDMEDFWCHILENELRTDKKCRLPMLITEVPHNPKGNREKMTQILIEKFDVESLCYFDPATLALFASGRTTGSVLDVGHGVTHTAALFDGYAIKEAVKRIDFGGLDVSVHLTNKLQDLGYSFSTSSEIHQLEYLKNKICSDNWLHIGEKTKSTDNSNQCYSLPDGTVVKQNTETIQCQRVLFEPNVLHSDLPGIHEILYDTMCSCPIDVKRDLHYTTILAGGPTMCKGLQEYLKNRVDLLLKSHTSLRAQIIAPPERKKSVWIGGSIIASLSDFPKQCKSKLDYYEHGPSIFHTN